MAFGNGRSLAVLGIVVLGLGLALPSVAHDSGYAYLRLRSNAGDLDGELEVASRDARFLLGIPGEAPAEDAWAGIAADQAKLARYARERLGIRRGTDPCSLEFAERPLERLVERDYARLRFRAACPSAGESLSVQYDLLFDDDPNHRALLALAEPNRTQTAVFVADARLAELSVRPDARSHHFLSYLREGLAHIATGYDHLLFLLALLLPATASFGSRGWVPRDNSRSVVVEVVKVVTAFTLAHSLTLGLAALGWISLSARFVEPAIAASVLVAAFNNLQPFLRGKPWVLALGFGLIHGLGFAALLGILGLPFGAKGIAILAFNLGVEVGQLAVVAVVLPFLLWVRRSRHYQRLGIELPSFLIAWTSALWILEGLTGYRLLPLP